MPDTTDGGPAASTTSDAPKRPQRFDRVLLKLSGEAFCPPGEGGIDAAELEVIAGEIKEAASRGTQVAVVVGGGNLIRGSSLAEKGLVPRATADYMGMLGTVMNGLALREALVALGVDSRVMSALDIRAVAEPFIRLRAIRHMERGRVVVLAAGTGNPFFTTDTCAALRATELECDAVLKATKVDGVYSADPNLDPSATRFEQLSFAEAMEKNLKFMDMTALAMCRENKIPVLVFDFKKPGNIDRVVRGEPVGTLLHHGE